MLSINIEKKSSSDGLNLEDRVLSQDYNPFSNHKIQSEMKWMENLVNKTGIGKLMQYFAQ